MVDVIYRPKAAILDLDGSLVNVTDALPKLYSGDGKRKDYDAFHAASRNSPPYQSGLDFARRAHDSGHTLLVVTSRDGQWRELSCDWLSDHLDLPWRGPFQRTIGDRRPSVTVKGEIYQELVKHYDIKLAIEDDKRIIKLWGSYGIEVTVGEGYRNWRNPDWNKG